MARGNPGLPSIVTPVVLRKSVIFQELARIDADPVCRQRVLTMETDFRHRISNHIAALPASSAQFQKFNTSPFVLMFYSKQKGYNFVSEIEKDIIPAKVFSSMETSAGRMVETVVLPIYGWQVVPSKMHSVESVLDGKRVIPGQTLYAATLKSGPRCLNDEMAKDIGVDVVRHAQDWANSGGANCIDFTYGVLYGTKRQSNKKDWHILRNIGEVVAAPAQVTSSCAGKWDISYRSQQLAVTATVRVGLEWWEYLGGPGAWIELCVALIRACVAPNNSVRTPPLYLISDLAAILRLDSLPQGYNVSLLQHSQLEWLLFLARHFCDSILP